jgi:hypothetical protein
MNCITCDKELTALDMSFHKKMINRGATEFMCIECLCDYFGITTEKAHEMIEHFREQGCTLFT